MKRWPKMFGAPIVAVVLSFSLCAVAFGQDAYQKAIDKAKVAKTADDYDAIYTDLNSAKLVDESLEYYFQDAIDGDSEPDDKTREGLIERLELRQKLAQKPQESKDSPKEQASTIKKNPLYKDSGLQDSSNWMGKAFERIADLFRRRPQANINAPNVNTGGLGDLGRLLIYLVIGILAAILLYFIALALRHARWKSGLKRKAKAMLEDDEPERTLDEWLQQADELAAQGRYREAVRALYLASLLKFDEYGVARFERGETNWEHLARIRKSPRLPSGLDFEPATRKFDQVWYGFRVDGLIDVGHFRAWYQDITQKLEASKAA
ncbi:MAG: DUF4129 domain-containing protein [Fimbriimonadaceae bacterium]|nr:DUF4129 domain-containing protein [Fimbriimonadaceae bacterium]